MVKIIKSSNFEKMSVKEIIATTSKKQLFLIDCLGALASAFMLGIVLPSFESIIGMPKNVLYLLAFIAASFFFHSLWCFWNSDKNTKQRLKIIAIANLLYCCLTLALTLFYLKTLTIICLIYFALEMIIIVALSVFEIYVSTKNGETYT